MISKCFKIVYQTTADQTTIDHIIEISHPPEAIEEIEVPVYKKYYTYDKSRKTIDVDEGRVNEVIKLHRCKLCKLPIILDGNCEVVK